MKRKSKYKVDTKTFIIPVIIFSFSFFITSYFTINSINNFYYSHMEDMSLDLAKSYSHSISKATEATEVVNNLLRDKLLVASRTIASYEKEQYSIKFFEELANTFEVDELNAYNHQGEILYSNFQDLVGWKAYEGQPVYDFMKSNKTTFVEEIRPSAETGIPYKYGYFKAQDGSFFQIGVKADKIRNLLGEFEMEHLLHEMKDVEIVTGIYFIDNDFQVIGSTNDQLFGRKIINQKLRDLINEIREYGSLKNEEEEVYEVFVPIYSGNSKQGTLAIVQSLKETEVVIRHMSIIGIGTLIIIYALLSYTMITAYKKNRKLFQLLYFDPVTDIPNEQYLKEMLTEDLGKRGNKEKALLLINFTNFHLVNLTYGYEHGYELLKIISRKLKELEGHSIKLYRFSVEGFILYVENYGDRDGLVSITNRINQLFNHHLKVGSAEHNLLVKIGIVEINPNSDKVDQILKNASISMNHINNHDEINYSFFDEEMESKLQRDGLIEKELRAIISRNDTKNLYLEYQPQVDLKTNKIICFEALARMRTESLGSISPIEFIDVAERKQLIVSLGTLILTEACNFLRHLKLHGYGDVKVAVNISGIQLLRDDFISTVLTIIKETGIEESKLELEITESVFLDNYQVVNEKLNRLRKHNISVALDDFGTGYSSFSRLRELSIDMVKIDQYFVKKVHSKEDKILITGDIISMAHKLGLKTVAEGVELQVQKDYLTTNGCDILQGYLFSKPLAEKRAIQLLK